MWEKANTDDYRAVTQLLWTLNVFGKKLNLLVFIALEKSDVCGSEQMLWLLTERSHCNSSFFWGSLFWQQPICWGEDSTAICICCYQQGWDTSFLRLNGVANAMALGFCKEWRERSIGGISSDQISSLIYTGNTEHGNSPGSPGWSLWWKSADKAQLKHAIHFQYMMEELSRLTTTP